MLGHFFSVGLFVHQQFFKGTDLANFQCDDLLPTNKNKLVGFHIKFPCGNLLLPNTLAY